MQITVDIYCKNGLPTIDLFMIGKCGNKQIKLPADTFDKIITLL